MGDVGETWKAFKDIKKKESSEKKKSNLDYALNTLKEKRIPFRKNNGGIHLVIDCRFDYWPTTGKFINRVTKKKGRGLINLLKEVEK